MARRNEEHEKLVQTVQERYGRLATSGGSCCAPQSAEPSGTARTCATGLGYTAAELESLPAGADLGLGCGAPLEFLDLRPGERVLDLGSGAGIDVLLAARQVGPSGEVIGVDMTSEMLARARANAERARPEARVDFRQGRLEDLPVDDNAVDAVVSNCVINLVPDKGAVFAEVFRVLRPGGRLVVSDIVLDGRLPAAISGDLMAWVGCVAGALPRQRYLALLETAGLDAVEVLRDVDFLATAAETLPADLSEQLACAGVRADELAGVVRSITYRAHKPRPGTP